MILMNTIEFLNQAFTRYYLTALNNNTITPPKYISQREFAFVFWGINQMIRHTKIDQIGQLRRYLKDNAFKHIYISGAYYKYPDFTNMNRKERLGTDFLVDIDADHINTPCKKRHDRWRCIECNKVGVGMPPKECTCGSRRFQTFNWICDECLTAAKNEIFKLLDIFLSQFNVKTKDILIHFSGHRGYHLIIQSDVFKKLDGSERHEIVDFLTSPGKNEKSLYVRKNLCKIIAANNENILKQYNFNNKTITTILKNRESILNVLESSNPRYIKKMGISSNIWRKLVTLTAKKRSINLDIPVSIDLHRLIRFVNSLHGKTGFMVQSIPIENLKSYDPFTDPIFFDEKISINVETDDIPQFRINKKTYGPYNKGKIVTLPLPAAIFVTAKGVARYIQK